MLTSAAQIGFPRRVVAIYLLFSLAATLAFAGCVTVAMQTLLSEKATEAVLNRVGKLGSAIELNLLRDSEDRLQPLFDKAQDRGGLVYAAYVDEKGQYAAHTNHGLVGQLADEPIGQALQWGEISGVRCTDEAGCVLSVYGLPLQVRGQPAGRLVVSIPVTGWKCLAGELLRHAYWAMIAPLGLIAFGAWWLNRTTERVAEVEQRLGEVARTPHDQNPALTPVAPTSLASIGWNRLATHVGDMQQSAEASNPLEANASTGGRQNAALESLSDGVVITDATGRVDFANQAIEMLLGPDDSLMGSSFEAVLGELAPEQAEQLVHAGAEAEVVAELPLASDLGERTLRLARAPLRGDSTAGHVWNVRDVTQQKYAERSRDQFIDTATHELRTPLANIRAYAETLALGDSLDVEEQKEFCNTINTEATRLSRFVDDLLSISSLEVGTIGVNRSNTEVRRLVEEAAEKVAPLMRQRSLTFERRLGEKLGEARLDKDKVSGMLVNLLGNAAKYTPEGGSVTLNASREGETLRFEVVDTGVGIAEEESEKVFEKFFRSENPAVNEVVGTGLGLPLAREIARLHRGDLTVASTLGEGSTFTATLPVA